MSTLHPNKRETAIKIARAQHQVNLLLQAMNNEKLSPTWERLDHSIRQGSIEAVETVMEDPSITPKKLHDIWMAHRINNGWVYDPITDKDNKKHALLVPFEYLSRIDQMKDAAFILTVRHMLNQDTSNAVDIIQGFHTRGRSQVDIQTGK